MSSYRWSVHSTCCASRHFDFANVIARLGDHPLVTHNPSRNKGNWTRQFFSCVTIALHVSPCHLMSRITISQSWSWQVQFQVNLWSWAQKTILALREFDLLSIHSSHQCDSENHRGNKTRTFLELSRSYIQRVASRARLKINTSILETFHCKCCFWESYWRCRRKFC